MLHKIPLDLILFLKNHITLCHSKFLLNKLQLYQTKVQISIFCTRHSFIVYICAKILAIFVEFLHKREVNHNHRLGHWPCWAINWDVFLHGARSWTSSFYRHLSGLSYAGLYFFLSTFDATIPGYMAPNSQNITKCHPFFPFWTESDTLSLVYKELLSAFYIIGLKQPFHIERTQWIFLEQTNEWMNS